MNENDKLIPFGKYKGQPLEAMAEDKQYTDWIVAQPWFRERYGNLYAVIINNFCEPSETPEHNALQARFLDDEFRIKFASVAIPRLWWYGIMNGEMADKLIARAVECVVHCKSVCERCIKSENEKYVAEAERCRQIGCREPRTPKKPTTRMRINRENLPLITTATPVFEEDSVDCFFNVKAGATFDVFPSDDDGKLFDVSYWNQGASCNLSGGEVLNTRQDEPPYKQGLLIEIKPEVGDDYPAILRQMRRNGSRFLFTRAYTGVGVNQPTFIQFMDSQGIRVIFEHEVDQQPLIQIDNFDAKQFIERVRTAIDLNEI